MAFSIRKMFSNISYFSKSGDDENLESRSQNKTNEANCSLDSLNTFPLPDNIEFDCTEADSTSKCTISLNLPPSKHNASKQNSLSDTDLLHTTGEKEKKKCRKFKLDIVKASQSMNNSVNYSEDSNLENTPKHKLLDCHSADFFKNFNFNQSFDISDAESVASTNEDVDIESLSDTDISDEINDKTDIKMCRKVEHQSLPELLSSVTPESFVDVEIDKNEEERIKLLLDYQIRLEKIENFLKKVLSDFQFHIEVSKVFNCKSFVNTLTSTDASNITNDVKCLENLQCGINPAGWSLVMEKEDENTKSKLKNQLLTMKTSIDQFITTYLDGNMSKSHLNHATNKFVKTNRQNRRCLTEKKKIKHYDFPDIREAMLCLFGAEESFPDDNDSLKCSCNCHTTELDTPKSDKSMANHSITSSIGNFTLDSTTLSAYSESLDHIVSFNSFDVTFDLYNLILQKSAIERITFYIQVHSIQLKCETVSDNEGKAAISFYCPTCKSTDYEENNLLKHILSQSHCEKLHFVYKTAYVKKCISTGKEIQPSTVLNSMTMYRDENKIVCFGDALYACSLCFENLIVGESILMSHCSEQEHVNRREMLLDAFY